VTAFTTVILAIFRLPTQPRVACAHTTPSASPAAVVDDYSQPRSQPAPHCEAFSSNPPWEVGARNSCVTIFALIDYLWRGNLKRALSLAGPPREAPVWLMAALHRERAKVPASATYTDAERACCRNVWRLSGRSAPSAGSRRT